MHPFACGRRMWTMFTANVSSSPTNTTADATTIKTQPRRQNLKGRKRGCKEIETATTTTTTTTTTDRQNNLATSITTTNQYADNYLDYQQLWTRSSESFPLSSSSSPSPHKFVPSSSSSTCITFKAFTLPSVLTRSNITTTTTNTDHPHHQHHHHNHNHPQEIRLLSLQPLLNNRHRHRLMSSRSTSLDHYHRLLYNTAILLLLMVNLLFITPTQCYGPFIPYKRHNNNHNNNNYGGYGNGNGNNGDNYNRFPQQQTYPQYGFSVDPYPVHGYRKYYRQYLPGPQFCPETGRTVCTKVSPFYPTDEVFAIIKMARAKRFNISSEFVDESENDPVPIFESDSFSSSDPNFGSNDGGNGGGHRGGNGFNGGDGGGQPLIHLHNFDFKSFGFKDQFRATVPPSIGSYGPPPPPIQQHRMPLYSGDTSMYASASASASAVAVAEAHQYRHHHHEHQAQGQVRFKRQIGGGGSNNDNNIPLEPICPSRVILIEPKAALNDKRQWKFIVNLSERDPRLKQAIKVEVCMTQNQPCSNQISLPFGFSSRCRQKYIKKKLISLDPSGQSISSENFFAPSCCVCEVIRTPPNTGPFNGFGNGNNGNDGSAGNGGVGGGSDDQAAAASNTNRRASSDPSSNDVKKAKK